MAGFFGLNLTATGPDPLGHEISAFLSPFPMLPAAAQSIPSI